MKLVVLTGAGISAESGLKTFRDADGFGKVIIYMMWPRPKPGKETLNWFSSFITNVESGFSGKTQSLHIISLAELENNFDVEIITQNIDDLHERAGSTQGYPFSWHHH